VQKMTNLLKKGKENLINETLAEMLIFAFSQFKNS